MIYFFHCSVNIHILITKIVFLITIMIFCLIVVLVLAF